MERGVLRALTTGGLSGVLAASLASACLVTDAVRFGEPNVPAHLERAEPAIGYTRVPDLPQRACNPDGEEIDVSDEMTPWMLFRVRVSDPNLADRLFWKMLVNGTVVTRRSLPASTSSQRNEIEVCLPLMALNAPCSHVEVLVSSTFDPDRELDDPRATLEPDLSLLDWWVLGRASTYPAVTPLDCVPQDAGL